MILSLHYFELTLLINESGRAGQSAARMAELGDVAWRYTFLMC